MSIEVEQKFRIAALSELEGRLAALGSRREHTVDQVDCYFAHPSRDFAQSDEALRLRRVGDLNYITYKGPKLDATTKTRREIEIPLADGESAAAEAGSLLAALGFTRVADVYKRRTYCTLHWRGRDIGVALDHVADLGDFVELELIAELADVEAARDCIVSLAKELGLAGSERRSYLELLLAQQQCGSGPARAVEPG
jgi:adenylate cyclase class 2